MKDALYKVIPPSISMAARIFCCNPQAWLSYTVTAWGLHPEECWWLMIIGNAFPDLKSTWNEFGDTKRNTIQNIPATTKITSTETRLFQTFLTLDVAELRAVAWQISQHRGPRYSFLLTKTLQTSTGTWNDLSTLFHCTSLDVVGAFLSMQLSYHSKPVSFSFRYHAKHCGRLSHAKRGVAAWKSNGFFDASTVRLGDSELMVQNMFIHINQKMIPIDILHLGTWDAHLEQSSDAMAQKPPGNFQH